MRLERLNNLPFNAVKRSSFAIFILFVSATSFIEIIFSLSDRGETGSHLVSLRVLGGE